MQAPKPARVPLMVHGFFCEDVRFEVGGSRTYVGVLGPKFEVPKFPVIIPKLAIVVTINFDSVKNRYKHFWIALRTNVRRVDLHDDDIGYEAEVSEEKKPKGQRRRVFTALAYAENLEILEPQWLKLMVRVDDTFFSATAVNIIQAQQ